MFSVNTPAPIMKIILFILYNFPTAAIISILLNSLYLKLYVTWPNFMVIVIKVFLPIVSRSSVCHSRVCIQGQLAGVLACSAPTGHGVLLQPRPGSCGEHVHQRPGVLCLPSGPRHGVFVLQKGNNNQQPFSAVHIKLTGREKHR